MSRSDKSLLLATDELSTRRRLYKLIRSLPEGDYDVTFTKKRSRVTNGQRGYYWGYLLPEVGRLIGHDREMTNKVLNARFLSTALEIKGESGVVVLSLADLDPIESANYFSNIRLWVWETYRVRLSAPRSELRKPA